MLERKIRMTDDNRVSVLDTIAIETSTTNPRTAWTRLCKTIPEITQRCERVVFPGRGQRPTLVMSQTDSERLAQFLRQMRTRMNTRSDHVYLIRHGKTAFVKIGIACDVSQRWKELQAMNPILLTILGAWQSPKARWLEHTLHHRYAPFQRHGEWFCLSARQRKTAMIWLDTQAKSVAITTPSISSLSETEQLPAVCVSSGQLSLWSA